MGYRGSGVHPFEEIGLLLLVKDRLPRCLRRWAFSSRGQPILSEEGSQKKCRDTTHELPDVPQILKRNGCSLLRDTSDYSGNPALRSAAIQWRITSSG
jgi:hypothetical protein